MKTIQKIPFIFIILSILFYPISSVSGQIGEGITSEAAIAFEDLENCARELQGSTEIYWPIVTQYFDVVIVQDASGSFTQTMPQVKETLKEMIDLLDLDVTANGYPKERAMLVTYQGSHGFGISTLKKSMLYQYYTWFGYKLTSIGLTNDQVKLNSAIDAIAPVGATPTIDGLTLAQRDYTGALNPNNVYDAQFYLEDGEPVQRRTIYFLITDGVANSGLYENFPAGTEPIDANLLRPEDRTRSYTWVYESIGKAYFETYWNDADTKPTSFPYKNDAGQEEFFRTFTDELGKVWYIMNPETLTKEQFFMYVMNSSGDIEMSAFTYDSWENYRLMMESMKVKATELKTKAGLPNLQGEPLADATFVAAYWEDFKRFVAGNLNGITYRPSVRPVVTGAVREMASSEALYISHNEGADFAEFQKNLMQGFIDSQSVNGRLYIKLDPNVSFVEDSLTFYFLEEGGGETEIALDYLVSANGTLITVLLESMPKGRYRIAYRMIEDTYLKASYYPVVELKVESDGGNIVVGKDSGILNEIAGFEYPPCEIVPTLVVPPVLPETGFPNKSLP